MVYNKRVLLVSFEIAYEDTEKGRSEYNRIYSALNDAIKENLTPLHYWEETTAFVVVSSDETASAFLVRVWNEAKMRSTKDRLLVLDSQGKDGAAFGSFEDEDLFTLLPFVKRLAPKKR